MPEPVRCWSHRRCIRGIELFSHTVHTTGEIMSSTELALLILTVSDITVSDSHGVVDKRVGFARVFRGADCIACLDLDRVRIPLYDDAV